MNCAIRLERIVRDTSAMIEARRRRQASIEAARAAKRAAKAAARIDRRVKTEDPEPPPGEVSKIINLFRVEYESLNEGEQLRFEAVARAYAAGRVPVGEWVQVVRSLKATYRATLPPEPAPGERRRKAGGGSPAGW